MSKSIYLLLIALLLVLVLGAGYLVYLTKHLPPPRPTPSPSPSPVAVAPTTAYLALTPKLVKNGQSNVLEVYLSPQSAATQPVSMLNLKLDLKANKGSLIPQGSAVKFPDAFRQGGWTVPFNKVVTNPDDSLSVSFSVIYASPEAFQVQPNYLFFSLPLKLSPGATITATVDSAPDTSEGYDKQMGKLDYVAEGQPVILQSL